MIFQTSLIIAGSEEERLIKAKTIAQEILGFFDENHPDIHIVAKEKLSISINVIRNLQQKLSLKPYAASYKIAIIVEAQNLTLEAQNAFLKTLEEPTEKTILILTAPSTDSLIATVVSRCQIIKIINTATFDEAPLENALNEIAPFLECQPSKRFLLSLEEKIETANTKTWLEIQKRLWRRIMLINNNCAEFISTNNPGSKICAIAKDLTVKEILRFIEHICLAQKLMEKNINRKLCFENLAFNMPTWRNNNDN